MGVSVKESNPISTDIAESVPLIITGIIKDSPAAARKNIRYNCAQPGFLKLLLVMET